MCLFCGQIQVEHATIAFVLSRRTHRRDVLGAVFISRVRRTDAGNPLQAVCFVYENGFLFKIRRFFMLENIFHLKENHTDAKTEIIPFTTLFNSFSSPLGFFINWAGVISL